MTRPILLFLAALLLAAPLGACGKKADPTPPGESDFPRSYPAR